MRGFGDFCNRSNTLRNLQSITLNFPLHGSNRSWLIDVQSLLRDVPLRSFNLYAIDGGHSELSESFVTSFIDRHRERLRRLAIMRLRLSVRSLDYICRNSNVEELFITLRRTELVSLSVHNAMTLTENTSRALLDTMPPKQTVFARCISHIQAQLVLALTAVQKKTMI